MTDESSTQPLAGAAPQPLHPVAGAPRTAISAFGRMVVWSPQGPLELGARRRQAVFALLLINMGKVVSVASIIRNIWGSEPPDKVVATLQSYVSRLRKLVVSRALYGGAQVQLRYQSPGYVLDAAQEAVDVLRFEQAVNRGLAAQHRGSQAETFDLLTQALRGWVAPPFEDVADYEFAAREAARLDRLRLTALEERAETAFALDRTQEVLPELEQEAVRYPMRERLVCQLMRAQYRNGRQADALYVFERTRRYLAEELGADVSRELDQVHGKILRHDPSLALSPEVPAASRAAPMTAPAPLTAEPVDGPVRSAASGPSSGGDAGQPVMQRQRETRRLLAALETVRRGGGRTVALVGEAGTGKTWLTQRFEGLCRADGTDVLTVSCPQSDDMPAYWPWVQALRQAACRRTGAVPAATRSLIASLVPDLDPDSAAGRRLPARQVGTFAIHDAVNQVLLGLASRPLVLVLENFQWADSASLSLLRFLAQQRATSPLLIVVTFRVADDPDARATRAAVLQSPYAEEILLGALSSEETQRIVTASRGEDVGPEESTVLHERSGGNPYLLLELLESLRDGMTARELSELIPERAREVITERLTPLSADVRSVLRACAVLGAESTCDVVRELTAEDGVSPGAVRTAIRSGLLRADESDPGRIDFSQPLVRDVVRQEMAGPVRAELHRRVIGSLVSRADGPAAHAGAITRHARAALAAVPPADVIAPLVAKAEDSVRRLAYGDALGWLRHAAALAASPDDAPRYAEAELSVQLRRVDMASMTAGEASTPAVYNRIEYLGRVLGRPQTLVVAPARLLSLTFGARFADVEVMTPHLLELADSENTPYLRAVTHLVSGVTLHAQGRPNEALAELDTSLKLADVTAADHAAGRRLSSAARRWQVAARWLDGEPETAREILQRLLCDALNDADYRPLEHAAILFLDSVMAALEDDANRALSSGRLVVDISKKAGLDMWRRYQAPLIWASARLGADGPAVLRAADETLAAVERDGQGLGRTLTLGLLADSMRLAGQPREARVYVRHMHQHVARTGEVAYLSALADLPRLRTTLVRREPGAV